MKAPRLELKEFEQKLKLIFERRDIQIKTTVNCQALSEAYEGLSESDKLKLLEKIPNSHFDVNGLLKIIEVYICEKIQNHLGNKF